MIRRRIADEFPLKLLAGFAGKKKRIGGGKEKSVSAGQERMAFIASAAPQRARTG